MEEIYVKILVHVGSDSRVLEVGKQDGCSKLF